MARVHLIISNDERDRFIRQARREGMTFSAWLRAAAQSRLEQKAPGFSSVEEVWDFFRRCDAIPGPKREPDWAEHLRALDLSRRGSTSAT